MLVAEITTNIVTFPGLGLEFELDRVAFSLFGKNVYWYGIIIAIGFVLAVAYCMYRRMDRFGVEQDKVLDLLFFAVPAAIIGARAYYVIFELDRYVDVNGRFQWGEAIAIWDGGLGIYGGLIAAVLTGIIYCKVRKQPFWSYADVASYGFLIGQMIGRWGNFVNVEAFGGVTDAPWRMCSPAIADFLSGQGYSEEICQQILDGTLGVHPTFFYESLWNLIGFGVLIFIARKGRKFDGQIFLSYVIWYGVGRTIIESLRTDSLYFFNTGLRTSQIVGIVSVLAAVILMVIRAKTAGPATPPLSRAKKEKIKENGMETDSDSDKTSW